MAVVNDNFYQIDGRWYHGPWWKKLINPVLRAIQFWTDRPYVIYSKCSFYKLDEFAGNPPRLLGYGFGRVQRLKEYKRV